MVRYYSIKERQEAKGKRQKLINYIGTFGNEKTLLCFNSFVNVIYALLVLSTALA